MSSENPETREDCAPCADSDLMLKAQIAKLDDMELVDGNDSDCEKMDDE